MSSKARPTLAPKESRATGAKEDEMLDKGFTILDVDDDKPLTVRLGDVKGSHDAQLVAAIGVDFLGLLEVLTERQGLDLLAAVVWFARLVNGREDTGTYTEMLDRVGYEDWQGFDEIKPEDAVPEA